MEKEEIIIEAPVTVGGVTLVPVVKASLGCWQRKGRLSFVGAKQPLSLVVVSPQERRAFRIDGEEVPLEELIKEAPALSAVLEEI